MVLANLVSQSLQQINRSAWLAQVVSACPDLSAQKVTMNWTSNGVATVCTMTDCTLDSLHDDNLHDWSDAVSTVTDVIYLSRDEAEPEGDRLRLRCQHQDELGTRKWTAVQCPGKVRRPWRHCTNGTAELTAWIDKWLRLSLTQQNDVVGKDKMWHHLHTW